MFTLAWFRYELLVVAVAWSLLGVEAALQHRLGRGHLVAGNPADLAALTGAGQPYRTVTATSRATDDLSPAPAADRAATRRR